MSQANDSLPLCSAFLFENSWTATTFPVFGSLSNQEILSQGAHKREMQWRLLEIMRPVGKNGRGVVRPRTYLKCGRKRRGQFLTYLYCCILKLQGLYRRISLHHPGDAFSIPSFD